MSITQFSANIAQKLFSSTNDFPVSFDDAWQWLGFSNKQNGKTSLMDCDFVIGRDIIINQELGTLAVPRPEEIIHLSVDCFKTWGMMSRTLTGKTIREYFLECEKIAKQKTSFESIASNKDWDNLRSEGKKYRRTYTDRIKEAGGTGKDYAIATNQIYIGATGMDAKQIKQERRLARSKPARDALGVGELQIVAMTEWHLSEALPDGVELISLNQASKSQAERLRDALMIF